jgi:hypothetical protein
LSALASSSFDTYFGPGLILSLSSGSDRS